MKNKIKIGSKNDVTYYVFGLLIGVLTSIFFLMLFAVIMTIVDLNDILVGVFGTFAITVGAFIGSYYVGKKIKNGGLILGVINGAAILFLNVLFKLIFDNFDLSTIFFVKLIAVLLSSIIGGVYAVNKAAKRRV